MQLKKRYLTKALITISHNQKLNWPSSNTSEDIWLSVWEKYLPFQFTSSSLHFSESILLIWWTKLVCNSLRVGGDGSTGAALFQPPIYGPDLCLSPPPLPTPPKKKTSYTCTSTIPQLSGIFGVCLNDLMNTCTKLTEIWIVSICAKRRANDSIAPLPWCHPNPALVPSC